MNLRDQSVLGFVLIGNLAEASWGHCQDAGQPAAKTVADRDSDPLPPGAVARFGTTRLHHAGVQFLGLTANGQQLATVGQDGQIRLWETATGKLLQQWRAPKFLGYSPSWAPLALSPDSRRLALACFDKTVRVWDMATGLEVWQRGKDFGSAIAYSPDGSWLATTAGTRVRVLNAATGALRHELEGCPSPFQVTFSSDGKTIIAVGHDRPDRKLFCLATWDAVSGQATGDRSFEFASPYGSRLSPHGKHLVIPAPQGEALHIWDTATGRQIAQTKEAGYPAHIAFSGDGQRFTTLSRDRQLRVWESATGKLLEQFAVATDVVEKVALSIDGKIAATTGRQDDAVHLWEVTTGKELHVHGGHRGGRLVVGFAADGKSALTADYDGRHVVPPGPGRWSLHRWDMRTAKVLATARNEPTMEIRRAALSPNGRYLATASGTGLLCLIDTASGKKLRNWDLPTQVITIRTGGDVKKHESLSVESLVFSDDSAVLAAPNRGKVNLYDTASGKLLRELPRPAEAIARCCFYPDGKSLLLAEGNFLGAPLCRIDAETGAEIGQFSSAKGSTNALAVSHDGQRAARLSNQVLEMYDADSGAARWSANLKEWSFALTFSLDGRIVATGGRDAVVRLWDAATGRALQTWSGHNGEVTSIAFSADGRWIVTGGGNIALVWEAPVGAGTRKVPER